MIICNIRFVIRKALLKCWHTSLSMTICRNYPSSESERFLPVGEREENIPCDLNNTEWFRKIDASTGAVFFASGVFYYFLTEQVKALVQSMANAFPRSEERRVGKECKA